MGFNPIPFGILAKSWFDSWLTSYNIAHEIPHFVIQKETPGQTKRSQMPRYIRIHSLSLLVRVGSLICIECILSAGKIFPHSVEWFQYKLYPEMNDLGDHNSALCTAMAWSSSLFQCNEIRQPPLNAIMAVCVTFP